jgi:bacillithiol biosynthesis cysteine-adding enzyme BshC
MLAQKIALTETQAFSPFFLDYIQQAPSLKKFYNRFPVTGSFKDQILEKSNAFPKSNRQVLHDVLTEQYKKLTVKERVKENIASLTSNNTFTITTGHQLNIFAGPLYFIYKIVTTINTCKTLKAAYPEYNFVPVYWMASEDHDYDEIKYFRLYGKKYTWETSQTGAVGKFNTKDLESLFKEIPGDTKIFQDAYRKHSTLSEATRYYVNELFGDEGLITVDGDNHALKSLFKEVIKDDLSIHSAKKIVDETDKELESLGYKTQVHCRDINFFYLDNGIRNRIEKQNDIYKVIDTELSFTKEEINRLIDTAPEKFSPNVILRPLYEEMILPNIAYIGGPAEVIYWLQLKDVFQHFNTTFPILMPRNFAMIMDHQAIKKFEKLNLDIKDLFEDKNILFNHWVLKNSNHNLTVDEEMKKLEEVFDKLKGMAAAVDKTLVDFVGAEEKRSTTSLEKIERKLVRAEKRLQSDKLNQIESLKEILFPNGSLQERTDNFLNFYQPDTGFIQKLLQVLDPLDFRFNILSYS